MPRRPKVGKARNVRVDDDPLAGGVSSSNSGGTINPKDRVDDSFWF